MMRDQRLRASESDAQARDRPGWVGSFENRSANILRTMSVSCPRFQIALGRESSFSSGPDLGCVSRSMYKLPMSDASIRRSQFRSCRRGPYDPSDGQYCSPQARESRS